MLQRKMIVLISVPQGGNAGSRVITTPTFHLTDKFERPRSAITVTKIMIETLNFVRRKLKG